jgi:DNA topoisomerase-1
MPGKPLIIVESYTKTKTISKYLNNEYTVICSLGHINNLPKTSLGINLETWEGTYEQTNTKIVSNIRSNVKNASVIYLASDPDMEGEAIAHHIKNSIKDLIKNKECHRIEFHEITKKAVTTALQNPHNINKDVVNAQESRRFVDRLIGYKLSPLLWQTFDDNTLSAGRVQSLAVSMCVDIFNKMQEYFSNQIKTHWIIKGLFDKLEFKLHHTITNEIVKIDDKSKLMEIVNVLDFSSKFKTNIRETSSSESPSPPYTTTSLQQDAYAKYKFGAKKTMQIAQQLYESGYITYMRTDSTNISNDFKSIIIAYINESYDPSYAKFRNYKNKISNAQEAHEAIRVTNVRNLGNDLEADLAKLYKMIWKRTVASQMINAEYANIEVMLTFNHLTDYTFVHKKSFLVKQGYLVVYEASIEDTGAFKKSVKEGRFKVSKYICEASISTSQPVLYNEISLIKALEKEGVGRPSTYASIIEKIVSKKYVEKGEGPKKKVNVCNLVKTIDGCTEIENIIEVGCKAKDQLLPTSLGVKVTNYMKANVPFLLDTHFTAKMEDTLDKICDASISKKVVLDDFYHNHLLPIIHTHHMPDEPKICTKKESGIMKTKYGYCYYDASKNKYTNLESYLKWQQKSASKLQDKDIQFIKSLPRRLNNGTELHIGQYGLYIKDKNKNIRLDKSKWDAYLELNYISSC